MIFQLVNIRAFTSIPFIKSFTSNNIQSDVSFSFSSNLYAIQGDGKSVDSNERQVIENIDQNLIMEELDKNNIDYEIENPFATPKDMEYKPVNIRRQLKYFEEISAVGGSACVSDIYMRDNGAPDKKLRQTFWFIGKVARCTGTVSLEEAIGRQWNLIEEHAARLRHEELGPSFKDLRLELWTAPGDSEMDMVQNRLSANLTLMQRMEKNEWEKVPIDEIGFEGELEVGDEGLRVLRNDEGMILSPIELQELKESS